MAKHLFSPNAIFINWRESIMPHRPRTPSSLALNEHYSIA